MRLKIGTILLAVDIFLSQTIGFAAGFKNEPDGFRDIKWEADITTLKGMEYRETDAGAGEVKVYTRKGDPLRLEKAKLQKIEYNFWKGKFYSVLIYTKGDSNFKALKDFCFTRFEKGNQPSQYFEEYYWFGDISALLLRYDEPSEKGILFMSSQKLGEKIELYKREKKE